MANFFSGLWKAATHPWDEAKWWKDVVTGETSLKDAPGEHQRMMNDITVPILGNNKVSKNSDAIVGTIMAAIFGGPAIAGAAGSGAGGAAAGSTGAGLSSGAAFTGSFGGGATGLAGGTSAGVGTGAGISSGTAFTGSFSGGVSGASSPTSTSWLSTLMDNAGSFMNNMDATTPAGKQEQSEFVKSFSSMLETQRKLAAMPPSQRNKLLAEQRASEITKIFKDEFGEDL